MDATTNNNASRRIGRDIDNLVAYFGQFAHELLADQYGKKIWAIYQRGKLRYQQLEREDGIDKAARWRSESGTPPPKRVVIADDRMTADLPPSM